MTNRFKIQYAFRKFHKECRKNQERLATVTTGANNFVL